MFHSIIFFNSIILKQQQKQVATNLVTNRFSLKGYILNQKKVCDKIISNERMLQSILSHFNSLRFVPNCAKSIYIQFHDHRHQICWQICKLIIIIRVTFVFELVVIHLRTISITTVLYISLLLVTYRFFFF